MPKLNQHVDSSTDQAARQLNMVGPCIEAFSARGRSVAPSVFNLAHEGKQNSEADGEGTELSDNALIAGGQPLQTFPAASVAERRWQRRDSQARFRSWLAKRNLPGLGSWIVWCASSIADDHEQDIGPLFGLGKPEISLTRVA